MVSIAVHFVFLSICAIYVVYVFFIFYSTSGLYIIYIFKSTYVL